MRAIIGFGLALVLALGVACSDGDYTLERRGGPYPAEPIPDPLLGGSSNGGSSNGGSSNGGGGAGAGGAPEELIPFCDALTVTRAKCQRCHGDPITNAAPVPFVTFEDFHVSYGDTPLKWYERAAQVVEIDYMPYVDLNGTPTLEGGPVEPLTPEEKETLLAWFAQGALPEGGTECPE